MDKDKNQKNQSPGSKGEGSVNTGLDITRLSEIRAPQDFNAEVKRVIAHIPVDRPPKRRYFRVRPGDEWCDTLGLYETSSDFGSETYIVHPTMYETTYWANSPSTKSFWPSQCRMIYMSFPSSCPIQMAGTIPGMPQRWRAPKRPRHSGSV